MTLHEEQERVQKAVGNSLSYVKEDPWLTQRVLANAKGEEPVVKKITTSMILVFVLLFIAIAAIAAGIIYNQDWYWNNRNSPERDNNPEVYNAVMANMTENPEQHPGEHSLVQIAVQDVSWALEANVMTFSFKATPKEPEHFELHSMLNLDEDGASVDESSSIETTEDGVDRSEHWLWRTDVDLGMSQGYGHIPGFGPVADMMDDNSKQLLLIDWEGTTDLILDSGEAGEGAVKLPMYGSWDTYRTTEGDVYFWAEYDLDWLRRDFEKTYPDRKDDFDKLISRDTLSCLLTYKVVEYADGMGGKLHTSGIPGSAEFVIHPKK